ncbi:hypothetical protein SISNIDRAFT_497514 [Sistotremastrum niveocremeum HHB9708]|uniref:Uncharacterized protein n=1 Tax=Sistotremastrum niveocremeum HHB9708 TaxID=1314777 RepID=A0A164Q3N4_9AGAM|nr:hypothetical protein SISNIDRAFT_497514 [Sistotremastrum niveocremeum HHB9708]
MSKKRNKRKRNPSNPSPGQPHPEIQSSDQLPSTSHDDCCLGDLANSFYPDVLGIVVESSQYFVRALPKESNSDRLLPMVFKDGVLQMPHASQMGHGINHLKDSITSVCVQAKERDGHLLRDEEHLADDIAQIFNLVASQEVTAALAVFFGYHRHFVYVDRHGDNVPVDLTDLPKSILSQAFLAGSSYYLLQQRTIRSPFNLLEILLSLVVQEAIVTLREHENNFHTATRPRLPEPTFDLGID